MKELKSSDSLQNNKNCSNLIELNEIEEIKEEELLQRNSQDNQI